jgi:hydrogenase expression/formation protein HypE
MSTSGKKILLAHGSGGKLSHRLIEEVFLKAFTNPLLAPLNDQALIDSPKSTLAFTTDSYVVSPLFFPGGDIGKLSVCGTINDLAVGGAEPLTKVVERGKGDKIFINTTGIGVVKDGIDLSPTHIRPTDAIIVSGTTGDHGIAIMTHREGIMMDSPVESDCAALHGLVKDILSSAKGVKAMRDPTRGGLATILNELASSSGCAMHIREAEIPVKDEVRGACELLGFDPLYLANEGKLVAVVSRDSADKVIEVMKANPLGREAAIIGKVAEEPKGKVILETSIGNKRVIEKLTGEQLPRIC